MEPKSLNVVARQLSTRFFNRHAILLLAGDGRDARRG